MRNAFLALVLVTVLWACSSKQEPEIVQEAHQAVSEVTGNPEAPVFAEQESFTFPEQGLVCGTVRVTEDAPEQVYAYERKEGAVVGNSLRYAEIYGRCLAALQERDRALHAEIAAATKS